MFSEEFNDYYNSLSILDRKPYLGSLIQMIIEKLRKKTIIIKFVYIQFDLHYNYFEREKNQDYDDLLFHEEIYNQIQNNDELIKKTDIQKNMTFYDYQLKYRLYFGFQNFSINYWIFQYWIECIKRKIPNEVSTHVIKEKFKQTFGTLHYFENYELFTHWIIIYDIIKNLPDFYQEHKDLIFLKSIDPLFLKTIKKIIDQTRKKNIKKT